MMEILFEGRKAAEGIAENTIYELKQMLSLSELEKFKKLENK